MMKIEIKPQTLQDYLNIKYPITLYPEAEGGYTVAIADLPGCISQGDTLEEAVANIQDAKTAWIETAWECGDEIPLPS
ncbi:MULTISPECIES: type II toxin-antitoxin system HicB family antitoxin [unclassified Roseofilum]|uniref:type II toxin-antitoxin system HicB family antitoxin n=1 Tax=unclassified Roseofilum TaxID=2620099 RepID=UPI001B1C1E1D|nr:MULTISPECIES: type II toxin-antitoxin system HicB family antitoxin [unclassified Roseofilum]MBP0008683.1 type II toxin-antitoxin system HicB family antitoxin [Roseofilum sp. Belize Diploria]MBP0025475.1 type II toxin-antitoxin system HicB family antitoxin [Roseofilum sp. SID2]MBP0033092.1 type II toxin-antitoxin system HicB family antitoxin [Roseofilum sp. Belize BBD 4]